MVPPEVAKEFGMLETYPQSGVFWYRGQKDAVHFNSKEPEQLISKMVDVFFDKETQQQSSAHGSGKYEALNQSIVDACLRFVQRLYEVDEAVLIKVINDKCSHQRRPRGLGLYNKEKYLARKQQLKEKKETRERKQKKREEKKKLLELKSL